MMNKSISPLLLAYLAISVLFSCSIGSPTTDTSSDLPKLEEVDLSKINPDLFTKEEWFVPYYLNHFHRVANSVVDTGAYRGYFDLSVWRGTRNHHTYNARIMEGILSLAWFYTTDRPWNPYFKHPDLKKRIEASLEFWCSIQSEEGKFSEYGEEKWNLASTAFATKFVGRALWLLNRGPNIDKAIFEKSMEAYRKALVIGFTDEAFQAHGRNFTNQYANLWGGALLYLDMQPDAEIDSLLHVRFKESMTAFQSPIGFFYEKGGPDWGYNLNTHHSDLQVAWEFAQGTELGDLNIEKTKRWYEWFGYNAVKEPDSTFFYLNRAIETRQRKGYYDKREILDPQAERWVPQAEFVPAAHAFEMSKEEYAKSIEQRYAEMRAAYPAVDPLEVGEFSTFSPYAFLHHEMRLWFPSADQKQAAIANLPYLKTSNFIHLKHDDRSATTYAYIRKPGYYAIFNSGKIVTDQQRFGLGLIWHPAIGTIFQSQSRTDEAAYGTQAEGAGQVFEAADVLAEFKLNEQSISVEEGSKDLGKGPFAVSYALGAQGNKTIQFLEDRITVSIQHTGEFSETIPLLLGPNDSYSLEEEGLKVNHPKGTYWIKIEKGTADEPVSFTSDLVGKNCMVFSVKAVGEMRYSFLF